MSTPTRLTLLLLGALGGLADAQAQTAPVAQRTVPQVIYDAGGTPIGELLEDMVDEDAPDRRSGAAGRQDGRPALTAPSTVTVFPVVTTKAAPGRLPAPTRGKLKGGPGSALCVVGDDALSQQWLRINRDALARMQASCLVAAVRDAPSLARLRAIAGDVPLIPGSFDALASATGISVWPILVSPDGLISQ